MLSEGYFDIEVQRNAIKPLGFQLWDTFADQPLDITGSNLKCQVRRTGGASSALAANMTVTIIDAANGQFDITFDGRKFTTGSETDEALYVYDVLDVAPDGPVVLMRGRIILTPGVTY